MKDNFSPSFRKFLKLPLTVGLLLSLYGRDSGGNESEVEKIQQQIQQQMQKLKQIQNMVGGQPQSASAHKAYMWVTRAKTNGNIGGVSGANTFCKNHAPASVAGKNHRAIIMGSSGDGLPRNLLPADTLVHKLDGKVITRYGDLFLSDDRACAGSVCKARDMSLISNNLGHLWPKGGRMRSAKNFNSITNKVARWAWVWFGSYGMPKGYQCNNWTSTSTSLGSIGNKIDNKWKPGSGAPWVGFRCKRKLSLLCVSY